ncbi:flagellar basal body rod protein FlgF [Sinimarinibacterium sp. CAU 1509]|uniref:flagellar basal body rod protein FlgF n=1 Tax=Sinimarinibacterium sp. CAU 1509 TaxID=2562283 RepID=UPI0010AD41AB|nr:flagellar basal body rod protein FlgF [Sinimarinibacterium sp. CAU 1509]TJY62874.1 flagellar basal body rod protein FlgF [Sinimarinibacterium sp. CAU 1509]
MDRALYVAMTGAAQTFKAQAVNSHNLANASTTGFRAELIANTPQEVTGAGLPSRVNALGAGIGWDASGGAIQQTGRDLDVAMRDDVWLAVQSSDGGEAYTKAGNLQIDSAGQLRLASGQAVMGDGGPLSVPPSTQLSIGGDGTISVVSQGQGAETLVAVGRLRTVAARPEQLARSEDGLMRAKPGEVLDPAAGNVVMSGALESSNVNLPEAMVNMISLSRQFEMQVKLMRTAENNAEAAATLVRMGG